MKTTRLSKAVRKAEGRERLTEIRETDLVVALGGALEATGTYDIKETPGKFETTKGCNLPHQDYVAPA